MKHLIEVRGIKLYAFHGCMPQEAEIGGHYLVDVIVETDFSEAAASDELNKTIDYVLINQIVAEEMAKRSKLIEHVAGRIIRRLKEESVGIQKARLEIKKLCPPINGDVNHVAVVIEELF